MGTGSQATRVSKASKAKGEGKIWQTWGEKKGEEKISEKGSTEEQSKEQRKIAGGKELKGTAGKRILNMENSKRCVIETKYRGRPSAKRILDQVPKVIKRVVHRHDNGNQTQEGRIERAVGGQQCFPQDLQLDQWLLCATGKSKGPGHGFKHRFTTNLLHRYQLHSLT